jgi:hypothetical protein
VGLPLLVSGGLLLSWYSNATLVVSTALTCLHLSPPLHVKWLTVAMPLLAGQLPAHVVLAESQLSHIVVDWLKTAIHMTWLYSDEFTPIALIPSPHQSLQTFSASIAQQPIQMPCAVRNCTERHQAFAVCCQETPCAVRNCTVDTKLSCQQELVRQLTPELLHPLYPPHTHT